MKPNKILFIASSINGQSIRLGISGGEVRLSEIIREFSNNSKWEVHLLSNRNGGMFCKQFGLKNIINHSFNFKYGKSRIWFILFTIKLLFFLPPSVKNFEGYIYTADEQLYDVIPAFNIKKANHNKWIAVVHWIPRLAFWKRKKSKLLFSLIFMLGVRVSIPIIKYYANIVLSVSNSTRKQLLNEGFDRNKVVSVNCGVSFNSISSESKMISHKSYDAVFMKRIQSVKGAFDLIDIWKFVIRKRPNAKLSVIGGSIDNNKFLELIKNNCLQNNIIFIGPVLKFKEKIRLLKSSKIFILPSYEENWAIVMGEAMACKIPVLAYDLPELIDVWKDSFVHIPLGNKVKFAEEIIRYLDDKRLQISQAEKGYEYVQQFDWKKIAEREIQIIEKL